MTWMIVVAKDARKSFERFPLRDQDRLGEALVEMRDDPWHGDVRKLQNLPGGFRRRVGAYRILFAVDVDKGVVHVNEIMRRTSTTYRRR